MSLYAVIKGEIVDGIVIADSPLDADGTWICVDNVSPVPGPYWTYTNGVFSPPADPPPKPPTWVITKVAMISRFTPQEYVGIVGATKTDVEVQAWYDLFQAATQINLQDQRTIAGIESMVPKNLLTQPRATEILTTPAQPNEKP
jgi:hypothetical protein